MSNYKMFLSKLVFDTMAENDRRQQLVYADVDEKKSVRVGPLGELRAVTDEPKTMMNAEEAERCNEIFVNLVKTFENPQATIAKTRFARSHDEVMPSLACANQVALRLQHRFAKETFFRSFTARRVQLLDEDSHGQATLFNPVSIVRIEMDK